LVAAAGHEVVAEAEDEPSALERFEATHPDVVVIDGRLPPGGALVVVGSLRARDARVWIVVTAALDERELLRAALAAGASAGLERPFLPSGVEAVFAEAAARTA
jgi:DNA-binding NarL/FixJ family response regulator